MALASPRVRSTSIEAHEFSDIARDYGVYSVPKIVINDRYELTGALPEPIFVDTVLSGVAAAAGPEVAGESSAL